MGKDEKWLKEHIKENRAIVLERWPSIEICNRYMRLNKTNNIIHLISNLDTIIKNGFSMKKNGNLIWEWRDMEILRLYDWGQIHLTWCPDKKNEKIERKIQELIFELNHAIEKTVGHIYEMNFIYSMNTEDIKRIFF